MNRGHTTFYAQASPEQRPDIGREGQISGVPEFVKEDIMYQPLPHMRKETPYPANGSAENGGWGDANPVAFSQRPRKDIGETGLDAEVHGMASANNMVSPIHNWRPPVAYEDGGSAEKGWGHTHDDSEHPGDTYVFSQRPMMRYRKDIGRDEQIVGVHNFVNDDTNVQPLPGARVDEAYPDNGHQNIYPTFVQRPRKDIGETGIDAEVHGMASANNMVSPIPNWRPETAYDSNGSAESGPVGPGWGNGLPSLVQHHRFAQRPHHQKDIGEGGIDPEVHGMASANNMVSPIPNWRPDSAYDSNGSAESGPVGPGWGNGLPGLAQRSRAFKDIANEEVRPDVYNTVWNLVDPAALPRSKHAPLEFAHPWDEVDHILKMREIATLNYVDREDAALKYLREQIATAEQAAEAKEEARNPTAYMDFDDADKAREAHLPAKDEEKAEEPAEDAAPAKDGEDKKDESKDKKDDAAADDKKDDAAPAKDGEEKKDESKEEAKEGDAPAEEAPADEKKDESKEEPKEEAPKEEEAAPADDASLAKKEEKKTNGPKKVVQ